MNDLTPTQSRFRVSGMDCGSCATKIETAVRRIDGVDNVVVSVAAGTMSVTHRGDANIADVITKAVTALGYTAAVLPPRARSNDDHSHDHGAPHEGPWWQSPKVQLTLVCGAAIVAAYGISKLFPTIGSWAFIAAMAVGLVPIAQRAFQATRAGTPFSIEMLTRPPYWRLPYLLPSFLPFSWVAYGARGSTKASPFCLSAVPALWSFQLRQR